MSGRFFCAHYFSASRRCDGGAHLLSVAALPLPPLKESSIQYSFSTATQSTQTLRLRVLKPMPKAAVHTTCVACRCATGVDVYNVN